MDKSFKPPVKKSYGQELNNSKKPSMSLNSELPSLPPLLPIEESPDLKSDIGIGKPSAKSERAPGVSAAEEKRYLRVGGQLEETVMGLAMTLTMLPKASIQKDGWTLAALTPKYCDAWMDVARRDKRVLEILERLLRDSIWLPLIGIHVSLVTALAANHGINLLGFMGVKMPTEEEKKQQPEAMTEEQRASLILMQYQMRNDARDSKLNELSGVE